MISGPKVGDVWSGGDVNECVRVRFSDLIVSPEVECFFAASLSSNSQLDCGVLRRSGVLVAPFSCANSQSGQE